MPTKTSYAPGTPSWVDLASPDHGRLGRLLLVAVRLGSQGPGRGGGHYHMFENRRDTRWPGPDPHGGGPAAGLDHLPLGGRCRGQPWPRSRRPGGTVFVEPMDVLDVGRMAVFADPDRCRRGRVAARAPHSAPAWSTNRGRWSGTSCPPGTRRRPPPSTARCSAGRRRSSDMGGMEYTEWTLERRAHRRHDEHARRGAARGPGRTGWPTSAPPTAMPPWPRPPTLGATLVMPDRWTSPSGRFAVLADPTGAMFGVWSPWPGPRSRHWPTTLRYGLIRWNPP